MPSMRSVVAVADFVRFFLPLPRVLEICREISPHSILVTLWVACHRHHITRNHCRGQGNKAIINNKLNFDVTWPYSLLSHFRPHAQCTLNFPQFKNMISLVFGSAPWVPGVRGRRDNWSSCEPRGCEWRRLPIASASTFRAANRESETINDRKWRDLHWVSRSGRLKVDRLVIVQWLWFVERGASSNFLFTQRSPKRLGLHTFHESRASGNLY